MVGQRTPTATEGHVTGSNDNSVSVHSVEAPFILHPLINLSNTCYFNAGVQLLANCSSFVYGLHDSPFRHARFRHHALRLCRTGSTASQDLFQSFAQLLYDMEFSPLRPEEALSPLRALDCLAAVHPAFEGRGQQDCPEMVNVIIGSISEEGRQEIELESLLRSFEEDVTPPANSEPLWQKSSGMALAQSGEAQQREQQRDVTCDGGGETELSQYSSAHESGPPYLFPWSWWNFSILKIMRAVNKENEMLERKEKASNGQVYQNTFRPPKLLHNNVTDGFTGYMMSEVRCHSCGNTSRIVEPFSSLTIDIPSPSQRLRYARLHPGIRRLAVGRGLLRRKNREGFHWWNPIMWVCAATRMMFKFMTGFSLFPESPVTLQECLDIHFEPVELRGNNKYHCASCNCLSEATKRERLLSLPEYLLLQMKRFRYGHCFNTKKTDSVIFPLSWDTGDASDAEVLQLGDYIHQSVCLEQQQQKLLMSPLVSSSSCGENRTSVVVSERTDEFGNPCGNDSVVVHTHEDLSLPICTYTLEAVVNHHGSITGGHYTTFARKKAGQQDMWMFINDDDIVAADLCDVADSEEYMLLYKKQSLRPRPETFLKLREKARLLLATPLPEQRHPVSNGTVGQNGNAVDGCAGGDVTVYISRHWLQRMAFLEEPGPIYNRLCYCSEEQKHHPSVLQPQHEQSCIPRHAKSHHVHGPPVEWFYVPLSRQEYNSFYRMYGGNAAVTQDDYDALQREQQQQQQQ